MKPRNPGGTTKDQWKFLRAILACDRDMDTILRDFRMRPSSLPKWADNPAFARQWELINQCLARRAASEQNLLAIEEARCRRRILMQQAAVAGAASPEATVPAGPAAPAALLAAAVVPDPVADERERIRHTNGERAAQAFDEMVRRREERDAANARPAPVTEAQP